MPKATNTHWAYVTLVASEMQQWFQERASILRYTYIVYNTGWLKKWTQLNSKRRLNTRQYSKFSARSIGWNEDEMHAVQQSPVQF